MEPELASIASPAGDSREQREAEHVMVAALAARLGLPLTPLRLPLPNGGRVEIDAASPDRSLLCEVWAHQGPPKSAQRQKVLTDAFKLSYAATIVGGDPRLILLFSDEEAAAPFKGERWFAVALRAANISVEVELLPTDCRQRVIEAQRRQYR